MRISEIISESVEQGVAEGEVVPLGKKHRGDLEDTNSCVKCGGDLQSGTYMGHKVKVCQPCKQVYLPPNSGIDKQGNKINEQGVAEAPTHQSQDLKDVAEWMNTTPDKLNIVVKQEPIEKFSKQIREMYGTYDEFPKDGARTNRILKLLKRGADPLPMYVEANDPHLFVMEGRHRMVAFWLAGMKTIPVAYVSVNNKGLAEAELDEAKRKRKKAKSKRRTSSPNRSPVPRFYGAWGWGGEGEGDGGGE